MGDPMRTSVTFCMCVCVCRKPMSKEQIDLESTKRSRENIENNFHSHMPKQNIPTNESR